MKALLGPSRRSDHFCAKDLKADWPLGTCNDRQYGDIIIVDVNHRDTRLTLRFSYFKTRDYSASLNLITKLLREVKKLDDKPLLVEIFLLESYVHHAVGHLPKSRVSHSPVVSMSHVLILAALQ
jgi:hypothetical protein